MKAGIIFTGTGPILILTTYGSFEDPKFVSKLEAKGILIEQTPSCGITFDERGGGG